MSAVLSIGDSDIGPGRPCWIIAEIGVNHEGRIDWCADMIRSAAAAGADAVKLQTVDADESYMPGTESHELFSSCALTREETARMFDLARSLGVAPFTTCSDLATIEWVDRLDPVAHKISSGLLTHLPLIVRAARTGRPLLISSGMANFDQIEDAVGAARSVEAKGIGLFHCVSLYPAALDRLNLAAIRTLQTRTGLPIGWSDHSLGWSSAPLAVAAGACMIEKHYSFDISRTGFDHSISLNNDGLSTLVRAVREAEVMLGQAERPLDPDEAAKAQIMHRILVARQPISAGDVFVEANIGFRRPLPGLKGLAPNRYDSVLGRRACRSLSINEPISDDCLGDT
jgi:sialic acid synthase SpsE